MISAGSWKGSAERTGKMTVLPLEALLQSEPGRHGFVGRFAAWGAMCGTHQCRFQHVGRAERGETHHASPGRIRWASARSTHPTNHFEHEQIRRSAKRAMSPGEAGRSIPRIVLRSIRAGSRPVLALPVGQNTWRVVNPGLQKYSALPKFGFVVCVAHPGSPLRGDHVSSRSRAGERWTRQRRAREVRAGRIALREPEASRRRAALRVRLASMFLVTSTRPGNNVATKRTRVRQNRVVLAVVATVKPLRRCVRAQPGGRHRQFAGRGRPERTRLPGERGISRQPTAQGRPCVGLHLYAAVRSPCAALRAADRGC